MRKIRVNQTEFELDCAISFENVENNDGLKPVNFMEVELIVPKGDTETYCRLEREIMRDNYLFLQAEKVKKQRDIKGMYYISQKEVSKFVEHNILESECRVKLTAQVNLVDKWERVKSILSKTLPIVAFAMTILMLIASFVV